jgi:dTMP kinase
MKGKFIVIDGTDGAGKSTQLRYLGNLLKRRKLKTRYIHIPQHGRRSAAMVDDYLNGKYGQVDPYVASLFYAVDRFDAGFAIKRWLKDGYVVLCDRWVTANAGHQGGKIPNKTKRLQMFRWLKTLEYEICKIPRPDLTLLLHVPAADAYTLIGKKHKKEHGRGYLKSSRDLHEKDLAHLTKAEKSFLDVPKVFKKVKIIECMHNGHLLSPAEIHEKIWIAVKNTI